MAGLKGLSEEECANLTSSPRTERSFPFEDCTKILFLLKFNHKIERDIKILQSSSNGLHDSGIVDISGESKLQELIPLKYMVGFTMKNTKEKKPARSCIQL